MPAQFDSAAARLAYDLSVAGKRLAPSLEKADKEVTTFAAAVKGGTTTFTGFVKKGLGGQGGAGQLIDTHLRIIFTQMARAFVPALAGAVGALQDFSAALRTGMTPIGAAGATVANMFGAGGEFSSRFGTALDAMFRGFFSTDPNVNHYTRADNIVTGKYGRPSDFFKSLIKGSTLGLGDVDMGEGRPANPVRSMIDQAEYSTRAAIKAQSATADLSFRPVGFTAQRLGSDEFRKDLQQKALSITPEEVILRREENALLRDLIAQLRENGRDRAGKRIDGSGGVRGG